MQTDFLLGLMAYVMVTTITPGPNNLILLSSGANYGFRRTLPLMLGIVLGFSFMIIIVGVGIMRLFEIFPNSKLIMIWVSLAYTLYLAWVIASAKAIGETESPQLMSATQGALFQWVNAKGWVMALSAITLYAPSNTMSSVLIVAFIFAIIGTPCVGIWALAGVQVRRFISSYKRIRIFNIVMAFLLILSVLPILRL